jgi:hypothetical protein
LVGRTIGIVLVKKLLLGLCTMLLLLGPAVAAELPQGVIPSPCERDSQKGFPNRT